MGSNASSSGRRSSEWRRCQLLENIQISSKATQPKSSDGETSRATWEAGSSVFPQFYSDVADTWFFAIPRKTLHKRRIPRNSRQKQVVEGSSFTFEILAWIEDELERIEWFLPTFGILGEIQMPRDHTLPLRRAWSVDEESWLNRTKVALRGIGCMLFSTGLTLLLNTILVCWLLF